MTEFDLGQVVGADGKGIVSIELISTSGKNKTYRITFTDETYFDYTVKDGDDAISAIVTSWEQTLSDSKVPSEKLTKDTLDTKVDKVTGKGLSTNDYTDAEKTKLSGIETGANKTTVDNSLSGSSENPVQNKIVKTNLDNKANSSDLATVATSGSYNDLTDKPTIPPSITIDSSLSTTSENPVQNKIVKGALDLKADTSSLSTVATSGNYNDLSNKPNLATVATSGDYTDLTNKPNLSTVATTGSYNDLSNKPTIPTKTSDLTNDSDFVESTDLSTVATSGSYSDLSNKPTIPSKTSDLTNDSGFVESTDLATVATTGDYDDLTNKPVIPPGVVVDQTLDSSSTNAVANQAVVGGLNGKSDTNHTHSNWQEVYNNKHLVIQYNSVIGLCHAEFSMSYNFTDNNTVTYITGIPAPYRPPMNMVFFAHPNGTIYISLNATGVLQFKRASGTGSITISGVWVYIGQ